MIKSNIKESEVTKTIVRGFMNDFLEYTTSDVIVVGGGPCGTTAAMLLAREGLKTLIIEKDLKAGGGMWQGGMLFPKMVVEEPANLFLESFGIKMKKEGNLYTADSY